MKRISQIITVLENLYPQAICSLKYENPLQLLIATRLSAQCTDERVNLVTPVLFEKYKTVDDFSNGKLEDVENCIKSCGLYKTKAKDIITMCQQLKTNFDGIIPDSVEQLTTLQGVGRKTANLVVGDIFHKPAYVCDTHCIRITNRLGLTEGQDPYKVELQLREILPPEKSNDFCHRMVLFGRDICNARKPKCTECPLINFCDNHQ